MKLVTVAACSMNQTPRDWKNNVANILEAIQQAKKQDVSILCTQEMGICAYGMEDDYFCLDVSHRSLLKLKEISKYTENIIVAVGLPIVFNNSLYNAVATIVDRQIVGFTCKPKLASDGVHYETRMFKSWPVGVVQQIEIPELDGTFPIGDIHFNIGGIKLGYEICESAWTSDRNGRHLAAHGMDIILNPSASHFAFGKFEIRKRLVIDGSRAFNATYIYANALGNEGRIIYDSGNLIAQGGVLVAQGKRFSYKNVLLTTAIVDVHITKTSQVRSASFQPDVENYNKGCIAVDFNYPLVKERITAEPEEIETWETSPNVKHEECTRAIGLASMDYIRKSHTKGFAVSLSGGADSAMVTYLCAMGIKLAVAELGSNTFRNKYCPWVSDPLSVDGFIRQLITTAYQATAQSGAITKEAAKQVAAEIGVVHFEFDVDPIVQLYKQLGKQVKGSELNFEDDDIVLQNLQARVRAPSIWIIANMQNKLLLTTSNMSEAAVGYATMDGDTAGCVAPISGLSKVYIREYLKWVAETGMVQFGRLKAMEYVVKQQPTAELRPANQNQTDEDDLMPYWLLHKIETLAVNNRYVPTEIYVALKQETEMLMTNNQLIGYITKFFRLFTRNQWKRERTAMSFHMDDHNLDPKTWCRVPILSGGYEEELEELQAYLT